MRRGLIAWSKSEVPEALFAMRVAQAQAALVNEGLDAFVAYLNITRPAAATWFTGFVPYWSEGVLVVPRTGRPFLCVALSKRVQGWIEQTAAVGTVISTPAFAAEAAKRIALDAPHARIGVLERDDLPTGHARALASAGGTLVDATRLYRRVHATADPAEIALTSRAAAIADDALTALPASPTDGHAVIAQLEAHARLAGAEDVFVALAPDLAGASTFLRAPLRVPALGTRFAARLTLAYKGHWVRVIRTFGRADAAGARLADAFAAAVAALPDSRALATCAEWLVEGTVRSRPLEALGGSAIGPIVDEIGGGLVSVSALMRADGRAYAFGGPAIVGAKDRSSALLVAPFG